MKNTINPSKVINTVNSTLQSLKEDLKPEKLSTEGLQKIKAEIRESQRLAMLAKLQFQQRAMLSSLKEQESLLTTQSKRLDKEILSKAVSEFNFLQDKIKAINSMLKEAA